MLLAVGCAAAIVVLFYAEENWRGKHAWEKYKRESEARGDRFEWSAVVPPPVADEQNFAATPLFAELFPKPSGHPRLFDLPSSELRSVGGNWREARMEDFAVWRGFFPDEKPAAARPGPFIRREGQSSEGEESRKNLSRALTCWRRCPSTTQFSAKSPKPAADLSAGFQSGMRTTSPRGYRT